MVVGIGVGILAVAVGGTVLFGCMYLSGSCEDRKKDYSRL